jgi:hypothetical protein
MYTSDDPLAEVDGFSQLLILAHRYDLAMAQDGPQLGANQTARLWPSWLRIERRLSYSGASGCQPMMASMKKKPTA